MFATAFQAKFHLKAAPSVSDTEKLAFDRAQRKFCCETRAFGKTAHCSAAASLMLRAPFATVDFQRVGLKLSSGELVERKQNINADTLLLGMCRRQSAEETYSDAAVTPSASASAPAWFIRED